MSETRDRAARGTQAIVDHLSGENARLEADLAACRAERDAARAAAIEEAAQVADSYGRVWRDRPGPALANTIAAKIRALGAPEENR